MQETKAYERVFTGEGREWLDKLLERYPTKQAALLPTLFKV